VDRHDGFTGFPGKNGAGAIGVCFLAIACHPSDP
jgi:hypothetical protein